MAKLRFRISMLDGYTAGPEQSTENPKHGLEGGEVNASTRVIEESLANIGAHHPRPPLRLEGGNSFTFVTDGIRSALEQARRAAKGKDVSLAGGASLAQQYLKAGLVDEMEISLVPKLLGAGERLLDTHLKFARR